MQYVDLRYHLPRNKRKVISELPPTSASMMGQMLRSHHFVDNHRNLYRPQKFVNLDPIHFE